MKILGIVDQLSLHNIYKCSLYKQCHRESFLCLELVF